MRQETKTYNIYKFDELKKEIQEKVIEEWQNDPNYLCYNWYGFTVDYYWKEKLNDIGFENAEIEFSGFYSQGDGASFTADINLEKIINTLIMCNRNPSDGAFFLALERMGFLGLISLDYDIRRHSSKYVHECTCSTVVYYDTYIDNISKMADIVFKDFVSQLTNDIEELRVDLCHKIYSDLENEYEYQRSYEYIKETILINEYEFTADGGIY